MNWIITKLDKLIYHTNLSELTKPLRPYLENYNWLLSDLEFGDVSSDLPINYEKAYFILTADDFQKILDADVQIVWGTLLAVRKDIKIQVTEQDLPYVEGNDKIWEPGNIQLTDADIEIDCFDSSYTIIKFRFEEMSNSFKQYFTDAVKLEKFR